MENTAKTSSCLAVTEKKTHRPGGCVGIFFQLFDWNRRFAKKKLFSKKLLPPVRAKQASKKFNGDEKMPTCKLHLITDENNGGFPKVKKSGHHSSYLDQKHEIRSPGLVARLMGLESMPSVLRDKSKKTSCSDNFDNGGNKFLEDSSRPDKEELNLEKGRNEIRPQKLQKTGISERRAVTRFGAEALQIKSVLSRSRRHHHHPKLASPLKSPRLNSSAKNAYRTCRLIDAATRILEPNLQSTNRAKFALTHSSQMHYYPSNIVNDGEGSLGKASCKNCGNLVNVEDFRPRMEECPSFFTPFDSVSGNVSLHGLERSKARQEIMSIEKEIDFQPRPDQPTSFTAKKNENKGDFRSHSESVAERTTTLSRDSQSQKVELSSFAIRHKNQSQKQISLGRDRISPRTKQSNPESRKVSSTANAMRGTKDFVSLNRNLSGRTGARVPPKVESSMFNSKRRAFNEQEDPLPQLRTSVRKRRTVNSGAQTEVKNSESSTASSMNRTCVKSRIADNREGKRSNRKDSDVISFTFNSPVRHKTEIREETEEGRVRNERKVSIQKLLPLGGDALGAILELKLKELTSQEDDELVTGGTSKRSTAMILQELICALTSEQPASHEDSMVSRGDGENIGRSQRMSKDSDHFSPGSVLEASFSSSSLDDGSGRRLQADSLEYSSDYLQPSETDAELLDSATTFNLEKNASDTVTNLSNNISRILRIIDLTGARLTGSRLAHAKQVLLNTKLLFGNAAEPSFVDELETIAKAMWSNYRVLSSMEDGKERNQAKVFIFDSLVECLDSKCCRFLNSGFNAWTRLPLCLNATRIIQEVEQEIERWKHFAGMSVDEIIEWEMSHSLGKWTDVDIEGFESGAEIDWDILQMLVDEIVVDLVGKPVTITCNN